MVYVEFFDKNVIENICSSLLKAPDRVYLLGDKKKLLNKHAEIYKKLFSNRNTVIEFIPKTVNKNSLPDLVSVLSEIAEKENDCFFDLTGGEELCLVAMGIIFEKYPEKKLQMHRFNINNNTVIDFDEYKNISLSYPAPMLSVMENIMAYGGEVVFDDKKSGDTYSWNMTEDFKNDVDIMWRICSEKDVKSWNTQIGMFEYFERYNESGLKSLTTVVPVKKLKEKLKKEGLNYVHITTIINKLSKYRLAYVDENDESISITYKNSQVKRCLTKQGQILELIVYLMAERSVEKNGEKTYNDVMTGVYIDWDGELHRDNSLYDTENEIDIIMMHNMVPVFLSCKNGRIDMDELYKLNTVAERFGGKYAKKVLVATALDNGDFSKHFRQRAQDMNIKLIEPIGKSFKDFEKSIKNAWI